MMTVCRNGTRSAETACGKTKWGAAAPRGAGRRGMTFPGQSRKKALRGSFTIEAAYIFPIIFFCMAAMIRFAWFRRNLCLADFELREHTERAARIEAVYDPEGPDTKLLQEDLSSRFSAVGISADGGITVERGIFRAESTLSAGQLNASAAQRIFSPENTMRAATAVSEFASKIKAGKGGTKDAADSE